jgi:hypothetical protein
VRQLLPSGRGNVTSDLKAKANEGLYRLLARRQTTGDISSLGASPVVTRACEAAVTAQTGSGNGGEFACAAAPVHAARPQEGECVKIPKAADGETMAGQWCGASPAHKPRHRARSSVCGVKARWSAGRHRLRTSVDRQRLPARCGAGCHRQPR